MHTTLRAPLANAMKGAGLHFLAVVASITVIYLIVPISPSSSQTTVWFLALLLVIGAVSLFKLIGYLAIAMWHLLWFVTAPHSPRKRRLELWGVVVAGAGIAFCDRGSRVLAGIPGEWRLLSVEQEPQVSPRPLAPARLEVRRLRGADAG